MQHLQKSTTSTTSTSYKKLDSCIDNKIQCNLLRFLRQHKMRFTGPEWKILNDKHNEVSNLYGIPKIDKAMIIESAINTQNSEIIEIFEPNDLKLRPITGDPKCPTRKLSQLIDILLKPFLKHIKSFIRDSLNFLNKCPRDVDEDTEIVTSDVISWYTSILYKFVLDAIDYFLTKYQGDLHPRFKKKCVLESTNFILKNNTLTFDSEFYLQTKGTTMGRMRLPM